MEWLNVTAEAGLGGLFLASFLAATVLPGGSEPLLWGFLSLHPAEMWPALGLATLGNTAGGMTSWWCGRYLPRWQKLRDKPLMICDTGHNIDGIREIVRQLDTIAFRQLHIVFGVVKDKDVTDVLALLPKRATYYFCQAQIPRAMEASVLAEKARHAGLRGEVIPDVNEAKRKALKNASQDDLIFIGGSTFVVAEIEEL